MLLIELIPIVRQLIISVLQTIRMTMKKMIETLRKSGILLQLLCQLLHLQLLIVGAVVVVIANQTIDVSIYLPSYHRLEKKTQENLYISLICCTPIFTSPQHLSRTSFLSYFPLFISTCKYNNNDNNNNNQNNNNQNNNNQNNNNSFKIFSPRRLPSAIRSSLERLDRFEFMKNLSPKFKVPPVFKWGCCIHRDYRMLLLINKVYIWLHNLLYTSQCYVHAQQN